LGDFNPPSSFELKILSPSLSFHPQNIVATQHFGSSLLAHLRATISQMATGRALPVVGSDPANVPSEEEEAAATAALRSSPADKLVYYNCHDINQFFLRNFFRLNFRSASYNKNQVPLGGMLSIELYSAGTPGSIEYLKFYYTSQSYTQQRGAQVLSEDNPPSRVFVTIPECCSGPGASCPIATFLSLTAPGNGAIERTCLAPVFEPLAPAVPAPTPLVVNNRMYSASAMAGSSIGSAVAGGAVVTAGGLLFTSAGRGMLAAATGGATTTTAADPFIVAVQQAAASDTANI
jgi:hypothetical protein